MRGLDKAADDDADELEVAAPHAAPATSESRPREPLLTWGGVSPDAKTRPAEANQWLATADKALQPTPLEAAATPVMMPERTCPVRTDPRGVSGHGRTIRAVLSILLKVAAMRVPDHEAWVEENGRMACQIEG